MPEVRETAEFNVSADDLWKLVGDFGGLIRAMGLPVETQGEGLGQTRTIKLGPDPMVERLEELDPASKRLVYSIVEATMPLRNYRSTMQVSSAGEGSSLSWTGTFEAEGSEDDAVALVRGIYQGGIAALRGLLET